MSPFVHALNICTLAGWLSVAAFGTVGIVVKSGLQRPDPRPRDTYDRLETVELAADFLPDTEDSSEASEPAAEPDAPEEAPAEPPQLPEIADTTPLPDVPDFPAPAPAPKPEAKRSAAPVPVVPKSRPPSQNPAAATGKTGSAGQKSGSAKPDANRLSGGRMPAPSYPSDARAKGQSGTVVVEFIVGESGSVISAYAKRPSPWPILNERAVSAVQRWKFRPGPVAKFSRPIVFKLN